jgi:uncharacterized membrane protein YkvA (DUF1232 family)
MNSKLTNYVKTKFLKIADDLLENPQGLKFKLNKAREKINKSLVIESLGTYVQELKLLMRMLAAWLSRKYTGMSRETIMYIVVAIVYFVTPTDFVPDFIIGLGYVDDIAVIKWVLDKIKNDVDKFEKWEAGAQTDLASEEKEE